MTAHSDHVDLGAGLRNIWVWGAARGPGLALAALIAIAAPVIGKASGLSPVLAALAAGAAFGFLREDPRIAPGAAFAARNVLRLSVVLLGATVSVSALESLGIGAVAVTLATVLLTLLGGFLVARMFGLGVGQSLVASGAVAICGASAALAVTSALPRRPGRDQETATVIAVVTAVGSVAMIAYPHIAEALGMDARRQAIFLGATLHEMAQAAGAGYSVSPEVGAQAVAIKLLRVACLAPIVLVTGAMANRASPKSAEGQPPFAPWFLVGFVILAIAAVAGWIPPAVAAASGATSKALMLASVAALGMSLSPKALLRGGARPIAVVGLVSIVMAAGVAAALML